MSNNTTLRVYTKFLSLCTLLLIFAGGMVTSTGSGLAVPDWPLSYGSFFPPMVGGVFYEHGHRMVATFVGLLTLILACWLWRKEPRHWVKLTGWAALALVIVQGVLGGLTVIYFLPDPISISHATIAQTFFLLTIFLAYTQSKERTVRDFESAYYPKNFRMAVVGFIGLIYVQLIIGALMRHTGSGLAIPDFPTMGGRWVPRFDDAMLFFVNDKRLFSDLQPVTMGQIVIHFLHRLGALVILAATLLLHAFGVRLYGKNKTIRLNLVLLDILLTTQVILGIITVLGTKEPLTTSLHVANGAAFLGAAFLLLLRVSPLKIKQW
jgi:cytochrome c oxidase assembly protein subunit 15